MPSLAPPIPSRRVFWSVVASCIGVFAVASILILVMRPPMESLMSNGRLARVIGVEVLLAAVWIPVLRSRGWSLACTTVQPAGFDVVRGLEVLVASYAAYWLLFVAVSIVIPTFRAAATALHLGGAPSWWMVALVSLVNPIAEEFLYLGFITNVLRPNGEAFAIMAGVLARTVLHAYQGPAGVLGALALGVVFGIYYFRTGRLWPVVIAHSLADGLALGRLVGGAA